MYYIYAFLFIYDVIKRVHRTSLYTMCVDAIKQVFIALYIQLFCTHSIRGIF